MKTLLLCLLGLVLPIHAQIDLFTGQPYIPQGPALEKIIEPEEPVIEKAEAPKMPEMPGEPSVMIVLGENTMPAFAYPPNVRGFRGLIDWKQVPELGYDKEEVKEISILRRQPQSQEGGATIYAPSVWHFRAEKWETVYNGSIPYLEDLMFLEDSLRVRLSTRLEVRAQRSSEGYQMDGDTGAFGIYQAVNAPASGAVSKIIVVKAEDNRSINRLKAAFEAASDVPPIIAPPALPALDTNAPAAYGPEQRALPEGVSIFEKIEP